MSDLLTENNKDLSLTTEDVGPPGLLVTPALDKKLMDSLKELETVTSLGRERVQEKILQFSREVLRAPKGLDYLSEKTPKIVAAGFFQGGNWEHPEKLLPHFVRGSLLANGHYPIIEALSELRILAIVEGRIKEENFTRDQAEEFLVETLALNLDLLFTRHHTEETRQLAKQVEKARHLFEFISKRIDSKVLFNEFLREIVELTCQRPIMTKHIVDLIRAGEQMLEEREELKEHDRYDEFLIYYHAVFAPSPMSIKYPSALEYRQFLKRMTPPELEKEAQAHGTGLRKTGLAGVHSAVLLRFISKRHPELVPLALGLNDSGIAVFEKHQEFVQKLIRLAIRPSTAHSIYGLSVFLERHLLSQRAVLRGIEKLVEIDIQADVQKTLLKHRDQNDSITPNAILVSGLISVLGQPLGVGQGNNPTCQSARGISLWSQHDPGYLIDLLISAARNSVVEVQFEGVLLRSNELPNQLAGKFDPNLDPVSLVLSPHLDTVYNAIMARVGGRGEDGHKWANPALYGRWINFGFESVLDITQTVVKDYQNFVRRFYATHHPLYNDENVIAYANPVGIFVTSSHADLIGLHAVSIQRVEEGEDGHYRVYFYNPNNEGRQNWGQGIRPRVYGHGERPGESSLPFDEFTSRLYAFHYNPYEEGDGFAVPSEQTERVVELAKTSWGKSYQWMN